MKQPAIDYSMFLQTLQERFAKHSFRHPHWQWQQIYSLLHPQETTLACLLAMEETGGEPDVVAPGINDQLVFIDCAKESPSGRRSLCYDIAAHASRKENKPAGSAEGMALQMGVQLLTEAQYRLLQTTGEYDLKTSSWVQTPADIRSRGGALFCDRRYGHVFTYHNGAESYYAARGFRSCIMLQTSSS